MKIEKKFLIKIRIWCTQFLNHKITIIGLQQNLSSEFVTFKSNLSSETQKVILKFINCLEIIHFMYDEEKHVNLVSEEIKKIFNYINSIKQCYLPNNTLEFQINKKCMMLLEEYLSREDFAAWAGELLLTKKNEPFYNDILVKLACIDLKNSNNKYQIANDEIIDWILELENRICV